MGGTFNPVHFGHLRAAEEVAESLQLKQLIFMPAAKPPHKSAVGLVSFDHRYRMLELAVSGNPLFVLSDLEHQRPGKLPTWKSYRELFKLCHFVVVARPGFAPESLDVMLKSQVDDGYFFDSEVQGYVHPNQYVVYYREITLLDISSSDIRNLLASSRSVRYLLPDKVEHYIRHQGLYK